MLKYAIFWGACALAALAPGWRMAPDGGATGERPQVTWPSSFAGRALREVPIPPEEQAFFAQSAGAAARFTDGEREFVFRWVPRRTRRLHSSADCLRALGYDVGRPTLEQDAAGEMWSVFPADLGWRRWRVRERIVSLREPGRAWTDVSAWYWSGWRGRKEGPWMAVTILERGEAGAR